MKRKIYNELLNWKNTNIQKPLMVIGARQIGKTYIINEFCKKEFKEYIESISESEGKIIVTKQAGMFKAHH